MNIFRTILLIFLIPSLPIFISVVHSEENIYHLNINVIPADSKVRIMNIKPKYRHGISLKSGKYDIEVTHSDYESKRW